jgi:pyrroline-5-carboxylate reductase
MTNKIGIIGFGNMGSAIAERIKSKYKVLVFDKDKERTKNLSGISVAENTVDLLHKVDTVILAVKPQDFDTVLSEIKDNIKDRLIVSIAAGITSRYIEKRLGYVRLVRVMPNMPARIGKATSCLCKGNFATDRDLDFVGDLLKYLGYSLVLNEDMMDAATVISGSGPGYYFYAIESNPDEYKNNAVKFRNDFIDRFIEVAKSIGFDERQARFLVKFTVTGSDLLLKSSGLAPSELRKQIASKGGTTEAALEALSKGGSLTDAVKAALKRAKELSKKE